ncbi:hypothetical protein [Photorhabdus australis]|uniref:hypothetical protein n=1 Tax=Photorhabdus australis TaxID=286156 RepID=UPI00056C4DBB|nr:hypothetical protein [Photorhabdus australis]
MSKAVILLGDTTDHGGKVITAIDDYTRHLSSCFFVGCTHSPRSHRYLYPSSFKLLLCWLRSLTPVT